jgi:hypothetical protein
VSERERKRTWIKDINNQRTAITQSSGSEFKAASFWYYYSSCCCCCRRCCLYIINEWKKRVEREREVNEEKKMKNRIASEEYDN